MPEILELMKTILPSLIAMYNSQQTNSANYHHYLENRSYNSPSNTMSLMTSAGINPNAAAAGISNAPNYSQPFEAILDNSASDLLSQGLDSFANMMYDMYEQPSRIRRNDTASDESESRTNLNIIEAYYAPAIKERVIREFDDNHEISDFTKQIQKSNAAFIDSINQNNVDWMNANINNAIAQFDVIYAEYDLKLAQIKNTEADTANKNADTHLKDAETELVHAQTLTEGFRSEEAAADANVAQRTTDARVIRARAEAAKEQAEADCLQKLGCPASAAPLVAAAYKAKEEGHYAEFLHDVNQIQYQTNKYIGDLDIFKPTGNPLQAVGNIVDQRRRSRSGYNDRNYSRESNYVPGPTNRANSRGYQKQVDY